jgi:AcrR family transcriptional regulator
LVVTSRRRAHERAQRKEDILQAARAVFAQVGYHNTTVEAVAERAEVGKGTIYLYFESKDALRAELLLQALAELTTDLKTARENCSVLHPDERLRAMADAYLDFAQSQPDYFRLLNAYDRGDVEHGVPAEQRTRLLEASNRSLELVTQPIADGMALGLFLCGDPKRLAGILWGALNGALGLMAHPIRRDMIPGADVASLCRATVELFLRGITKEGVPGACGEEIEDGD